MYLAKKDIAIYAENPELYSNYGNVKTGRILCIIGIVLGAIYLLMMVWAIMTFGFDGLQNPELMQERMRELMGQ